MNPYLGVLILDPKQLEDIPGKISTGEPNMETPLWVIGDQKQAPEWVTCFSDINDFYKYLEEHEEMPVPEVAKYEGTEAVAEKLVQIEKDRFKKQEEVVKEWHKKQENWKWPTKRKPKVFCYTIGFSRVMLHQARGLMKGFEKIGCETKMMYEEDGRSRLNYVSPIGHHYLPMIRGINEFEPDLFFNINFYRVPEIHGTKIPFYTWVQDRIRNLNEDYAANATPNDFLGFLARGLMAKWVECGFPQQQLSMHPCNYDSDMFYAPKKKTKRSGIIYIEQQGAITPWEALEKMKVSYPPQVYPVLDEFFGRCSDMYSMGEDMFENEYRLLLQKVERDLKTGDDNYQSLEQVLGVHNGIFLYNFYHDVGNRWMRQRPLVEIAKAGLPLELYGEGWEKHPVLAPWAKGPVKDYKDIPELYRRASVALQLQHECTFVHRAVEGLACGAHMLVKGLRIDFEPINEHIKCMDNHIYERPGQAPILAHQLLQTDPPSVDDTNIKEYRFEVWAEKIVEMIKERMV